MCMILNEQGQYVAITGRTGLNNPPVPATLKQLARTSTNALNEGVKAYNETVRFAQAHGREIGWFPRKVNEDTGEVFDWGPKPNPTPLAPLYVLPEWAK